MNKSPTLFATACLTASALAAEKPNILLIYTDDVGYGDVGCYGAKGFETPNLDRMADEGMRFTDAHSPCTVCTPTRYSLMTGQMAFRIPLGGRVFTGVGGPSLIASERLTLPEMLRDKGYATAAIGKWHVGWTFFDQDGELVANAPHIPVHLGAMPLSVRAIVERLELICRDEYGRETFRRRLALIVPPETVREDSTAIYEPYYRDFYTVPLEGLMSIKADLHSSPSQPLLVTDGHVEGTFLEFQANRLDAFQQHPDLALVKISVFHFFNFFFSPLFRFLYLLILYQFIQ